MQSTTRSFRPLLLGTAALLALAACGGADTTAADPSASEAATAPVAAGGEQTPDAGGQVTTRKEPYFYGQNGPYQTTMTHDALGRTVVTTLPDGTSELMAHPGHTPLHARTSFGAEREVELLALCLPAARALLDAAGVRLCSFVDARSDAVSTRRGV